MLQVFGALGHVDGLVAYQSHALDDRNPAGPSSDFWASTNSPIPQIEGLGVSGAAGDTVEKTDLGTSTETTAHLRLFLARFVLGFTFKASGPQFGATLSKLWATFRCSDMPG